MTQAGYKYLRSYKLSVLIYDLTAEFCKKWVSSLRTYNQEEDWQKEKRDSIMQAN